MSQPSRKALVKFEDCVFLRKSSNVQVVTVPAHLLKELNWDENQLLMLSVQDGTLIVQKAKVVVA